jgi:hypothetical protein
MTSDKDRQAAEKIIKIVHLLNVALKEAHRERLEVDLNLRWGNEKRAPSYTAKVYRSSEEVIAVSPEAKV